VALDAGGGVVDGGVAVVHVSMGGVSIWGGGGRKREERQGERGRGEGSGGEGEGVVRHSD